jgi:hypothetical protein
MITIGGNRLTVSEGALPAATAGRERALSSLLT